jgi:hypothetical protein
VKDLYNGVKGTYVSPANSWQAADFPYYAQDSLHGYDPDNLIPQYGGDANLQADGGQRRWKDIQLPFTTSPSMAQRIAKIELLRSRNFGTGTVRCNMAAYQFIPLDILLVNNSILGWYEKYVEVSNVRLKMTKQSLANGQEVTLLGMELDLQETDSNIYAWSVEEQLSPFGYQQAVIPHGQIPELTPWPWAPGYVAPLAGDAIFPEGTSGPGSFGLQPNYGTDAQGNQTLTVQIKGNPPFNVLDEEISKPIITATGGTGGSIPSGNYVLAMSARDSGAETGYGVTDYLNAVNVNVPNAGGSISVEVTEWGSGDDGGDLYMAEWNAAEEFVWHWQTTLSASDTSVQLSSFNQSTKGGPDPDFDHFALVWQQVVHSGDWADTIYQVTSNTLTFGADGMTNNQWQGYTLSLLAKAQNGVDVIILNMPVKSSTASSDGLFTITIGQNSAGVQLPDLTTLLVSGDLVVMRALYTFTPDGFSDPNVANGYYPQGATGVEAGHLAIVLTGADAGDIQSIASVSQDSSGNYTKFNIQGQWQVTPTTGDLVVICAPTQADYYATPNIQTQDGADGAIVIAQPTIENLGNQTWLLIVATQNSSNQQGAVQYMPMRDIYFFGGGGTREVTANYTMVQTDGIILADATNGPITVTLAAFASIPNQTVKVSKTDSSTNTVTVQSASSSDQFTTASGLSTSDVLSTQGQFIQITIPA